MIVHKCDECDCTMTEWVEITISAKLDAFKSDYKYHKDITWFTIQHNHKEYCKTCFHKMFMTKDSNNG